VLAAGIAPAPGVSASTPEAWRLHEAEVLGRCLGASQLVEARAASGVARFGDETGYDALLIRGRGSTPADAHEQLVLCLFERATRKVSVSDVPEAATDG
jgi:hypothetical protein